MRNCLECKHMSLSVKCEGPAFHNGTWLCDVDGFDQAGGVGVHVLPNLARAIKTAETCPDFEGESDGE